MAAAVLQVLKIRALMKSAPCQCTNISSNTLCNNILHDSAPCRPTMIHTFQLEKRYFVCHSDALQKSDVLLQLDYAKFEVKLLFVNVGASNF